MKEKLSRSELVSVASMLFGLFFGAGNLIFPTHMGQLAGRNLLPAMAGFLITGVGLPLMGVASIGVSRSNGLIELSGKVGRGYSVFFTCALYLTIGPFFAIPRCAATPSARNGSPSVSIRVRGFSTIRSAISSSTIGNEHFRCKCLRILRPEAFAEARRDDIL